MLSREGSGGAWSAGSRSRARSAGSHRRASARAPTRAAALILTAAAAAVHGHAGGHQAEHKGAVTGAGAVGARDAPASWLAPKAPRTASGDTVCPVAAMVPTRSAAMESWYPADSTSPCASARGGGSGRLGSRCGRTLRSTRTSTTAAAETPATGRIRRNGRAVPAKATKAARPERAHQPVGAHAQHGVAAAEAGAGEAAQAPQVRADVARGEQAEQLGLGVRTQVPAASQTGVGQRPPAQRAQHVLAQHPRQQPDHHRPHGDLGEPRQSNRRNQQAHDDPHHEHGAGFENGTHTREHEILVVRRAGAVHKCDRAFQPSGRHPLGFPLYGPCAKEARRHGRALHPRPPLGHAVSGAQEDAAPSSGPILRATIGEGARLLADAEHSCVLVRLPSWARDRDRP